MKKAILAGTVTAIVLAGAGLWLASAMRQPNVSDFHRLDMQRQAVDMSMNVYSPLFSGYTADYASAFNEDLSTEEQAAVKDGYSQTLEDDRVTNESRLAAMRSSVALKEPEIKAAFDTYDTAYQAVIDYYEQYAINLANIAESVAGKCDLNSDLNVSTTTIGQSYTKAADACLKALGAAKATSDEPTKSLLGDVEKLVTARRDAFKETVGKQGFEATVSRLSALTTLLTINTEIQEIQSRYVTNVKTDYTKLVNRANDSNESLKQALKPFLNEKASKA